MEVPRHWRLRKQRYRLVGEVCPHAMQKSSRRGNVCPRAGNDDKTESFQAFGRGVFAHHRYDRLPVTRTGPFTVALGEAGRRSDHLAQLTDLDPRRSQKRHAG